MGNYNEKEDAIYCGECGAHNKKSAIICTECEKKIRKKHSPAEDFFKKHLIDEASERAGESLFTLIRNFLTANLYGTVLTVSIVATIAVSAVSAVSYSKPVNTSVPITATENATVPEPEPEAEEPELSKETPMWEFLGKTLGEVKEIWGTNYRMDTIGGSRYFEYPEGAAFYVPHQQGDNPNSEIFIVSAYDAVEVLPGITGNSTFLEVQAALPDKNLVKPERTFNEMDEVYEYYLDFDYEGHTVVCVWEDDPDTSEMWYIQVE